MLLIGVNVSAGAASARTQALCNGRSTEVGVCPGRPPEHGHLLSSKRGFAVP